MRARRASPRDESGAAAQYLAAAAQYCGITRIAALRRARYDPHKDVETKAGLDDPFLELVSAEEKDIPDGEADDEEEPPPVPNPDSLEAMLAAQDDDRHTVPEAPNDAVTAARPSDAPRTGALVDARATARAEPKSLDDPDGLAGKRFRESDVLWEILDVTYSRSLRKRIANYFDVTLHDKAHPAQRSDCHFSDLEEVSAKTTVVSPMTIRVVRAGEGVDRQERGKK